MPPGSAERPQRRALLSVSDKTGLVDLARGLAELGFELIASGGSAEALRAAGLSVVDVAQLTGSPEMLGGRVKRLHPRVHGGLLARRDHPGDQRDVEAHAIATFDLVAVNLYPFEATVARPEASFAEAIVFGVAPGAALPIEDVARAAQTLPYELLVRLAARVPRVYEDSFDAAAPAR